MIQHNKRRSARTVEQMVGKYSCQAENVKVAPASLAQYAGRCHPHCLHWLHQTTLWLDVLHGWCEQCTLAIQGDGQRACCITYEEECMLMLQKQISEAMASKTKFCHHPATKSPRQQSQRQRKGCDKSHPLFFSVTPSLNWKKIRILWIYLIWISLPPQKDKKTNYVCEFDTIQFNLFFPV